MPLIRRTSSPRTSGGIPTRGSWRRTRPPGVGSGSSGLPFPASKALTETATWCALARLWRRTRPRECEARLPSARGEAVLYGHLGRRGDRDVRLPHLGTHQANAVGDHVVSFDRGMVA